MKSLTLRPWALTDGAALAALSNAVPRNYLSDRLPYPYTDKDADWWLHHVAEQDGKEGIFRAIWLDDRIVGNISVERKAGVYRRDGEIGYLLHPDVWGQGIMTAAVAEICPLAFAALDLLRITGLAYAPNTASRRVLEKSGFVQEGLLRQAVWKNGQIWDLAVYGLLKNHKE